MNTIHQKFGDKVRLRVCGICFQDQKMLLIQHSGLNKSNSFWLPPGGGVNENENIEEALKREFLEETNTNIEIERFLFLNEFIVPPLHGIELYFAVRIRSQETIQLGNDPELSDNEQIIKSYSFLTWDEIEKIPISEKAHFLQNETVFYDFCPSFPSQK